jgi:hypothetical protein
MLLLIHHCEDVFLAVLMFQIEEVVKSFLSVSNHKECKVDLLKVLYFLKPHCQHQYSGFLFHPEQLSNIIFNSPSTSLSLGSFISHKVSTTINEPT